MDSGIATGVAAGVVGFEVVDFEVVGLRLVLETAFS